jgi:pyruvate dehydrogenase E2 component (dihydrolipoyllysine-residue acetyltransferase)
MSDLVMPRLSDTMEEGTILRWLKRDGEHVSRGEALAEIETDKASMTYESDLDGTLQTVAREGDTLAVGELIARVGEGEAGAAPSPASPATAAGEATSSAGGSAPDGPTLGGNRAPGVEGAPGVAGAAGVEGAAGGERLKASPLARRMARESGIDLSAIAGSGPGGRIVKADVQASLSHGGAVAPAAPAAPHAGPERAATSPAPAAPHAASEDREGPAAQATPGATAIDVTAAKGETTAVEPSRIQRTIARRMAESKATIPDFTLSLDVDMERCVELRAELKRLSGKEAPTYNDMVVKACALALREHPRANGSYRDGRFELHSRVNVGVAVAVDADDPRSSALVVPTVLDADTKALGEIARETRLLAERVRDATITPPELSGATFTVSNLGMYGIRRFTAIVNPPQAAILAVGAVEPRPAIGEQAIGARHAMTLTLSCDHRILYGADAALFLARIRELLQEPASLTL